MTNLKVYCKMNWKVNMEFIENKEEEKIQLKAIFRDMLKYSPSKICGTVGNAVIVPVYTSLLPPEQYGLYSLSIAFLSFLCIIFSDWVGLSGLRFFRQAQMSEQIPKYLSVLVSILGMNLVAMFLMAFLCKDWFYSFFKITPTYLLCILILIIPVAIRALLFQLLRAQLKSIAFTFSTILNQILTILLSIFIIKVFHLGAMSLLLAMGISITITDIILIYQSNILQYFTMPKITFKVLLPIFLYGVPLAATSLSAWVINQNNKFIMNHISGFTEVGYVGVAYNVTLPLLMTIFSIITVAAIPRIIQMYESKIDVRPIISKFTGYYILISLPVVLIMCLYSKDFVAMLSDSTYHEAFRIIPYFALGTFFMGLADYTTLQYHLANKTYIEFIIKLISGITGIVLNLALIPKLGLEGVGIATLSANFLYYFLSAVIILPGLGLRYPAKTIFLMCLSFLPMAGGYYLMQEANSVLPIVQMIILMIIFYAVYYVLNKNFGSKMKINNL